MCDLKPIPRWGTTKLIHFEKFYEKSFEIFGKNESYQMDHWFGKINDQ